MTIRDNVKAVKKRILQEIIEDKRDFTNQVMDAAVEAILNGAASDEAREYMSLFALADKPEQLKRLMGEDSKADDPGVRRARAYLIANGPCGSGTVLNLENGVTNNLDV